ncbi:MAG: TonB-dependent receptor domain-containing protein, partial [Sphingobacterium sp.]
NTPGGLTLAQFEEAPEQDRPAGGPFPSASEQKAAIYNKTFLGGLINEYQITKNLKHVISVFGTNTNFENPFITNYELRKENNLGFRTYLSFEENKNNDFVWEMQLGAEGQKGWYHIKNHENNYGQKGELTDDDKLENGQHFYFYRVKAKLYEKLIAEGSIGLNFNQIQFKRILPDQEVASGNISLAESWLPRLGLSYLITNNLALRGSISKGYSSPTIAEIRSSDNQINETLQAEYGTNYEIGLRLESKNRAFIADLSTYHYLLNDGIIRQLNEAGNEFFVNAGKIKQKGVEANLISQLITPKAHNFLQGLIISSNLTLQDYTFIDYNLGDADFSKNKVTSIPKWIIVSTVSTEFIKRFELNITHNFTSEIPLNDANSFYANKYHLIQAKASWFHPVGKKHQIQLFLGVDNLLNQKYSLGNDINAMGNRFYNASLPRNFYTG